MKHAAKELQLGKRQAARARKNNFKVQFVFSPVRGPPVRFVLWPTR
jgi:hypothetical protein